MTRAFFIILSVLSFCFSQLSAQNCNVPGNIDAYANSSTTAMLKWEVVGAPTGSFFELELIENGQSFTGIPDTTAISQDSIFLTNLIPSTQYRFKIRMVCAANNVSAWSAASTFRTYLSNPSTCGLNLIAADNSCDPPTNHFPIEINNAPGYTLGNDVELKAVRVIFEHDWLIDVEMYLRSPDGTRVKLVDSIGSSDDNFGDPTNAQCGNYTEFSSFCSTTAIDDPAAQPPFIGTYFPKEPLANFHNGSAAMGTWVLEICDTKANNEGRLQFFEMVFSTPSCLPPSTVTVNDVFADGVQLTWDTTGVQADSVFIEIGNNGFRPASGKIALGDTLVRLAYPVSFPITIGGLTTFSALDAYVRYGCNGFVSANTCVIPFFTACENPDLEENFDSQSVCGTSCGTPCVLTGDWQNITDTDELDWTLHQGNTTSAGTGPSTDFSGNGRYIYLESSSSCALQKKGELRSPCILINAQPNECNLTFAYHMRGNAIGTLQLEISTDGGQNWQSLWQKSGNQGNKWFQQNISLSNYNGETAVFRFVGQTANGAAGDMAIDQIRFFGSSLAGDPNIFFVDLDLDGFGDENKPQNFCLPVPPVGYAISAGDCDDSDAGIYPGAPEILCNGIDENCNGNDDDIFIGTPTAMGDSTCVGGDVLLSANGSPQGTFYWLSSMTNGQVLGTGPSISIINLTENQTAFLVDSIPSAFGGCSSESVEVNATAMSVPYLSLSADSGAVCKLSSLDLMMNPVFDSTQSNPNYTWFDGAFSPLANTVITPSQSGQAVYFLEGKTNFGCADTVDFFVEIFETPTATIQQGDSLGICIGSTEILNGLSTGAGLPPFSYAWSSGLNFANIPVSSAIPGQFQTLILTVTDDNHCADTDSLKVHTLASITDTNIEGIQDVTECGGSDGSIQLQPLDGQGPYTYAWGGANPQSVTHPAGSVLLDGLTQGAYRITVSDNSSSIGCGMVLPLLIISAPGLVADIDSVQPASCFGEADGSIHLNVNGLAPTFLWSNAETTQNLASIPGGDYSVTVTDGACQLTLDSIAVPQPSEIIIQTNVQENVQCFRDSSGALELFVQGGTEPYDFTWSNGATTDSLPNLPRGSYEVTVSDLTSCQVTATYTLYEPEPIGIEWLQATDSVPCFADEVGVIQARASGGVGMFQYLWNTGANSDRITGLPAAMYTVTVMDENGCTKEQTHEIKTPDSLRIDNFTIKNPICFGVDDGEILVNHQGGTAPYTYRWTYPETTKNLTNLPEGLFKTTITDAKGCEVVSDLFELVAPRIINPNLDTIIHVGCFGDATGSIQLNPFGGLAPYDFYWNQVQDEALLDSLPIGTYIARIIDAQGCQVLTEAYEIAQPMAPLTGIFSSVEPPICFGDSTGSLGVQALGGTGPFTYNWNGNTQGTEYSAAAAGTYIVTITDFVGCTFSLDTLLEDPQDLSIAALEPDTIPCFGSPFGALCLDPYGGTGPLSVQWSNGKTGSCQDDLFAGLYTATVTDETGCEAQFGSFNVVSKNDLFEVEDLYIQANTCSGDSIAGVEVCVTNTVAPFAFSWNAPIGVHINATACDTLMDVESGHYRLTVTDAEGCTALLDTLISEPNALQMNIPITSAINPACFGDSTGALCAAVIGGSTPYTFAWNNGDTTQCLEDLPAGCYRCTVTDALGCSVTISDVVCLSAPAALMLDTASVTHDRCSNGKGAISLTVGGGVPGNPSYFFTWSNQSDSQNQTQLPAGMYSVTMTDHVGCEKEAGPFEVLPDLTPLITDMSTVILENVACKGDSTGFVQVTPQGGVMPYILDWENPAVSSFTLDDLAAGLYQATLTDGDLCTATYTVQISEPDDSLIVTSVIQAPTNGQNDGQIILDIQGGLPPYVVTWPGGLTFVADTMAINVALGFYEINIRDAAGCTQLIEVDMTTQTYLPSSIGKATLFPNPSHGPTQLQIELQKPQAVQVAVFSAQGKLMLEETFLRKKQHIWRKDFSFLPEGLYFMQVKMQEDGSCMLPFTVVR